MLGTALSMLNLVSTLQGLVEALNQQGHAVSGVEALIGVHMTRCIGIACDLPMWRSNSVRGLR